MAFNFKDNWYWIGPIIGGIIATLCPFIKDRIEEIIQRRRFKKNYLPSIVKDGENLLDLISKRDISRSASLLAKLKRSLLPLERDMHSILKYSQQYLFFILKLRDNVETTLVILESENYSEIQKQELIGKAISYDSKGKINFTSKSNSNGSENDEHRLSEALENIYTCIQALK